MEISFSTNIQIQIMTGGNLLWSAKEKSANKMHPQNITSVFLKLMYKTHILSKFQNLE